MQARAVPLLLPEGTSAAAAVAALRERLDVAPDGARTVQRTFWDTFDGRLHEAGLALVGGGGRLALAEDRAYAEQVGADHQADGARRMLAGDLPAGALRDRVEDLVEMRAVTPVARLRSRLHALKVLDAREKTVVRLTVEEPTVPAARGREPTPLRPRVYIRPVRGYDGAFARVRSVLVDELGLAEAPRPVHEEAVAASGGIPGGTSSKLALALTPGMRADAAAAVVLRRLLEVIEANLPGTLADVDSEFLHDLRVAVRRTRALQRELRGVFPPERLAHFRREFRWLQQATGPTRDLDVYLLDLDDLGAALPAHAAVDLVPLAGLLEQRRAAEQRKMVRALRWARTTSLLSDWRAFVGAFAAADEADRPDAARPVIDVAGERIVAVYRRMVRMGRAIDDASPAEALHDLRKKGKELRYLLEFFASIYPPEATKPMVAALKALQDTLGRFQDRQVQAQWLRSLGDDVAALDRGPAALMAMGLLVDRLGEAQAEARDEFAERFAAFADKRRRALVAEAFA